MAAVKFTDRKLRPAPAVGFSDYVEIRGSQFTPTFPIMQHVASNASSLTKCSHLHRRFSRVAVSKCLGHVPAKMTALASQ